MGAGAGGGGTAGGGGNGVMELGVSAGLVGDTLRGDVMETR